MWKSSIPVEGREKKEEEVTPSPHPPSTTSLAFPNVKCDIGRWDCRQTLSDGSFVFPKLEKKEKMINGFGKNWVMRLST